MFLISAATALAAIMATVLACSIVIDSEQRIREERITDSRVAIGIMRDRLSGAVLSGLRRLRPGKRSVDQSEGGLVSGGRR